MTRFEADQPNETWQADVTHVRLANGRVVDVLNFLDDHPRFLISMTVHSSVTTAIAVRTFTDAIATHGTPQSTLTESPWVSFLWFSVDSGRYQGVFPLAIRCFNFRRALVVRPGEEALVVEPPHPLQSRQLNLFDAPLGMLFPDQFGLEYGDSFYGTALASCRRWPARIDERRGINLT